MDTIISYNAYQITTFLVCKFQKTCRKYKNNKCQLIMVKYNRSIVKTVLPRVHYNIKTLKIYIYVFLLYKYLIIII